MSNTDDRDDIVTQNNQLMLDATHMLSTIDDLREQITKQAFMGCLHCQNIIYLGGAIEDETIVKCNDCHKETIIELMTQDQVDKIQLLLENMDMIANEMSSSLANIDNKLKK